MIGSWLGRTGSGSFGGSMGRNASGGARWRDGETMVVGYFVFLVTAIR